jgi:hypothetical protein
MAATANVKDGWETVVEGTAREKLERTVYTDHIDKIK